MSGAALMTITVIMSVLVLVFLIVTMVRSIQAERTEHRSIWREFGLGLALMILFFLTWAGLGVAQWQTYTDEQSEHGEPTEVGDFVSDFGQSPLENWQSVFLQLF